MSNSKYIYQILKKYFWYEKFRSLQEEIISWVIAGKDALVIMPTGGGKSLCYQIPALIRKGTGIVISPLIALMKDQVESLKSNGIRAAAMNSSLSPQEQQKYEQMLKKGELDIVYISPEKILTSQIQNLLASCDISILAIDEAHCISVWGSDFRKEYGQLAKIRKKFSYVPCIALTATADRTTQDDIQESLNLQENTKKFLSSFDRPNISLQVVPANNRVQMIHEFLQNHIGESGIIYCLSRKQTEQLSKQLNNRGWNTKPYHAGYDTQVRSQTQDNFLSGKTAIICATNAFGMGIDKPDVRFVIHHNMPANIESYYQEIWRAGRDGNEANAILFFTYVDLSLLERFAKESGQSEIRIAKLDRMTHYANSKVCRRRVLLSYFWERNEKACGNCDVCSHPPARFDGTTLARQALSGVFRANQKIGIQILIGLLRWTQNQEMFEYGYHKIKTFWIGKATSSQEWHMYLLQMIDMGLLEISFRDGSHLKITEFWKEVLLGKKQIELARYETFQHTQSWKWKKQILEKQKNSKLMLEFLDLRQKLTKEAGVSPETIFSQQTLIDLVKKRPLTYAELKSVFGISEQKIKHYGEQILTLIREHTSGAKGRTRDMSLVYFQEGLNGKEIAHKRGLKPQTIFLHLASSILAWENIDIFREVTHHDYDEVSRICENQEEFLGLKDLYEKTHKKINYGHLHLILAHIKLFHVNASIRKKLQNAHIGK